MALVVGTNCGFVTTAPTSDPDAANGLSCDEKISVSKYTSPSGAITITEIGWWCDNATEEANFEVGLYATDGAVVPNEAGTLLFADRTHAKGTGIGWKTATVEWSIDANTDYWLAFQLDDTPAAFTVLSYNMDVGDGRDRIFNKTTLTDPAGGGAIDDQTARSAIYAVWEAAAPEGATRKIKIAGTFQDKPIKTKVGGVFVDKPIKIKVGGTFQDA